MPGTTSGQGGPDAMPDLCRDYTQLPRLLDARFEARPECWWSSLRALLNARGRSKSNAILCKRCLHEKLAGPR